MKKTYKHVSIIYSTDNVARQEYIGETSDRRPCDLWRGHSFNYATKLRYYGARGKDRTDEGSSPPTTPSGVTRQEKERRNTSFVKRDKLGNFI